ncbi:MAG: ABC transporter ATP-binding protein [Bacteroidota bacterium]
MAKSKVNLRKVFTTIIWPRRKSVMIGLGLIVVSRIAGVVLPYGTKFIIDDVLQENNLELLKQIIPAILAAIAIQAGASFLLTRILSVEAQHLISQLRVEVQRHIIYLPIRFFDNHRSGELVSRIMTDVEGVRNIVGTGLVQLIGGTLTTVISLFFLISISPTLTVSVLVPMIIFGIISLRVFGYIRPVFRERGKLNAEVTARLTETLNGIRVIKGFNAEKQEVNTFEEGADRLFQNVKKSLTATALMTSSGTFLIGLTTALVFGIGGYLGIEQGNELTAGDLVSFLMFLAFMTAPILQMSNIGSQITEAFAGLDRTEEIMNTQLEDNPDERSVQLSQVKGDIRFDNVTFAYDQDKHVIHNVSFDAPAGSVTALVGTSGSGKSTIAGLAASFLVPEDGKVLVDEQDLSKVSLGSFREHIGVVLQDDFLFEGTIRQNILFPRPDANEQELMDAVKAAHVDEFTNRFEEGLETIIGERGVKLSGGQRQRLAIARAILADPRILILDEATSNLDTESESYIQQSLARLMQGRTTFVIAHRLSTIRKADQILVIEKGRIAEQGVHDELIAKEGRYYELYTYQAKI